MKLNYFVLSVLGLIIVLITSNGLAGDSPSSATVIELDKVYNANLSSDSSPDYYQFTLSYNGNVTIEIEHKNPGTDNYTWFLSLHHESSPDSTIRTLELKEINYKSSFNEGLSAGVYLIKIDSNNISWLMDDDSYLKVSAEQSEDFEKWPNNSKETATVIEHNTSYSANIYDGDSDYYKFTLAYSANVNITLEHKNPTEGNRSWSADLSCYDTPDNIIRNLKLGESNHESSFNEGLPAGVYLVKIYPANPFWPVYDQYYLTIKAEESEYFEKWPNDSKYTATVIELNTQYSGNLSEDGGDIDYYQFTLPYNGNATIKFENKNPTGGNRSWIAGLYHEEDPDNPIATLTLNETELSSSLLQKDLQAGIYLIKISPANPFWPIFDQYYLTLESYDPSICPEEVVYAQNPATMEWIAVPTPCDIPYNWISSTTKPENFKSYCGDIPPSENGGYFATPELWIRGVINIDGGTVDGVFYKGGEPLRWTRGIYAMNTGKNRRI